MKNAVDTVIATIQVGVPVARIELLDEAQMGAIARYASLPYAAAPTLFFEFHGPSEAAVREQAETTGALAAEAGGAAFEWVTTAEARERLWKARHDAYYSSLALRPGSKGWATDVCVPISALADAIVAAQADAAASPLRYTMVAHAGDGNFHMLYLLDPSSEAELAEAERLSGLIVERALAAGGTCTGEHGVGLGKRSYLALEHGDGVSVMRAIKQALDPHDLMNPGKVLL
jgi:D-lactate dehydrogenase (cytochrome)